jgi:hypothetical protein
MLGQPDRVVAKFFGCDRKLDFLAIQLSERDLGRRRVAEKQGEAKIHDLSLIALAGLRLRVAAVPRRDGRLHCAWRALSTVVAPCTAFD